MSAQKMKRPNITKKKVDIKENQTMIKTKIVVIRKSLFL